MPSYRAAWLLPISQPPIRDAWLRIERGRIVAFGPTRPGDFTAPDEIDLGNVAVLPGLTNAHTHLELSWMRGRIKTAGGFPGWIRSVMELRRGVDPSSDEAGRAVPAAARRSCCLPRWRWTTLRAHTQCSGTSAGLAHPPVEVRP